MPLLLAPLFAVSLGLGFGLLTLDGRGARGYLAARSSVRLFGALAFFPALLFVALLRPSWALMHFVNRAPSALLLAGAAIAAGLVPLVYERASVLAALTRGRAVALATLPGLLGLFVLVLLHHRALVLSGPAARLDEPEPLLGSAVGVAFVLVDLLLLVAAGLTAFALVEEAGPDAPGRDSLRSHGTIGRKLLSAATSDAGGVVRRGAGAPLGVRKIRAAHPADSRATPRQRRP